MFSTAQTNKAILLTFRDDFNKFMTNIIDSSEVKKIYQEYDRYYHNDEIKIPNTLFDILYLSLIPEGEEIDIDWTKFKRMLTDDYSAKLLIQKSDIKSVDIKKELKETIKHGSVSKEGYIVDLFTELTRIAWDTYKSFMNIEDYGLPSKNIFEWLINCCVNKVNGNEIKEPDKPYPHVMKTLDAYGLICKYDNRFLCHLLEENGIDFKAKMKEEEYDNFRKKLLKIVRVDPSCVVVSSPSITAGKFRAPEITDKIIEGINNTYADFSDKTKHNLYETQLNYARIYCDYFYNKKVSFSEIENDLRTRLTDALECKESKRDDFQNFLIAKNHSIKSLIKNAKKYIEEMLENANSESDLLNPDVPEEMNRGPGCPSKK